MSISFQMLFDRAFIGLRAQGYKLSGTASEFEDLSFFECRYQSEDGCRCAWGHADPIGTQHLNAEGHDIVALKEACIGIAAELDDDGVKFAHKLQLCHDDCAPSPTSCIASSVKKPGRENMEANLRALAAEYGLTVPA